MMLNLDKSRLRQVHDCRHVAYVEDYFLANTISVERITPAMIRVVLKIDGGDRLVSSCRPDEWVRLSFQPDPNTPVTLPVPMENGKWGRPDGAQNCPSRPYTVRNWNTDRFEMTIDIVAHEGGVASTWAINAKVGDVVGICNPEGRFWLPEDAQWLIMLTDITGLPAVGRVLEELPEGFRAIVHVEIPSDEDRQDIDTVADASIVWHICHSLKPERPGYTELPRIAREITEVPPGSGYIYIAGEAKAVSDSRKHFRDKLCFDKNRIDAVGYWIEGHARG